MIQPSIQIAQGRAGSVIAADQGGCARAVIPKGFMSCSALAAAAVVTDRIYWGGMPVPPSPFCWSTAETCQVLQSLCRKLPQRRSFLIQKGMNPTWGKREKHGQGRHVQGK